MDCGILAEDDALADRLPDVRSDSASVLETDFGGMRAILAMTSSTSLTPITFLRRDSGRSICEAPTSSITSIALSGSLRSLMYFAASSTAALIASAV